jgi:hypothetical protein
MKKQSKIVRRIKEKRRAKPKIPVLRAASSMAAAAAPKGCCTIESPGGPDRQVEGITKAECDAIQNAHAGTVTQWNPGSCA